MVSVPGLEESSPHMQPYFEKMVSLTCRFGGTNYNESSMTMFSDAEGTTLANTESYNINVLDNINTTNYIYKTRQSSL